MAAAPARRGDPWLHAWYDPVAGIKAFSNCVRLADLNGDGDAKLLIADRDRKLKVYKGKSLISEHALLNVPVALCTFYCDTNWPRTPAVAVASGPYVFIYRNLRPYYKFALPPVRLDEAEVDVWNQLRDGAVSAGDAHEQLAALRDGGSSLSARSLDLLALEEAGAQDEFVSRHRHSNIVQQTVITCMETLKKNMQDEEAVSSLVIGTENCQVLVLDPVGSSILQRFTLPAAPVEMAVTGMYDVEYRIVVACRNGSLYTIKNGQLMGTVIELEAQPVGLVRIDKSIVVATMDSRVSSYHVKGKRNFSLHLEHAITNISLVDLSRSRNFVGYLVALANGEVRMYNQKTVVATIATGDVVTAMRFGSFGREDGCLTIMCKSGALTIKILQRVANLEASNRPPGPPPEQDVLLNMPKKTKLYVEQTQRERDNATEMHRIFQRDLCKLRLATARAYVKTITDGHSAAPMSSSAGGGGGMSVRVTPDVSGLGPFFKIKLAVQNTGGASLAGVPITLIYPRAIYRIRRANIVAPLLIPGLQYHYEVDVECIDADGTAGVIHVLVLSPRSAMPLSRVLVNMPMSEPMLED